MKTFQRITSFILALILCFALCAAVLPGEARAASDMVGSGICSDDLTWVLNRAGTLTISGSGYMAIFGPGTQNGAEVYAAPWYYLRSTITDVVIENGAKNIGVYAFYGLYNLTSVTIPSSVTSIEYGAFEECSSLKNVYYSGTASDYNQIEIDSCNDSLEDAQWHMSSVSSATAVASGTCGDGLSWTLDDAGTLVIRGSGKMFDYSWNSFPWYSRKDTIKKVILEDGVTSIGCYAFYRCGSLKSFTIPDSVTAIGEWAFYGCTSLTSILIPENVNSIEDGAFSNCTSLPAISVDANNRYYKTVDGVLFSKDKQSLLCYPAGHSGTSYTIPDGVTYIGNGTFEGSGITSVTIPRSVVYIGLEAFNYCDSLRSVYYRGSSSRRSNITIVTTYKGNYNSGNDSLLNAAWYYNS